MQMEKSLFRILDLAEVNATYGLTAQNEIGFFLCRRGQADILVNDRVYPVNGCFLCFHVPYTSTRIVRHSDDFDGFLLLTELDRLYTTLPDMPLQDVMLLRGHPCIRITSAQYGRMEQLVELMLDRSRLSVQTESGQGAAMRRLLIRTLLQALFLEALEIYFEGSPVEEIPQSREDNIFNRFFHSLMQHCTRERKVTFYATEQHLSPNYFSSVVKAKPGPTAIQWIETASIVRAQHYLSTTSMSIKEIADAMNFTDQSTFGRYFRKHCGMSPTDYRNRK